MKKIDWDDSAVSEAINDDDFATLTASSESESDSSDGEMGRSADASSAQTAGWVSVCQCKVMLGCLLFLFLRVMSCVLNIFRMCITDDIINKMVMETNRYAEQWIQEKVKYILEWKAEVFSTFMDQMR